MLFVLDMVAVEVQHGSVEETLVPTHSGQLVTPPSESSSFKDYDKLLYVRGASEFKIDAHILLTHMM